MFGSQILDVAIGLILVFLLVSLICSAIREGIEACLKTRASFLEHGIRSLLQDNEGSGIASKIYNHPLVDGLFSGTYRPGSPTAWRSYRGRNLPSYIPAKNFAEALLDIAARGTEINAATAGRDAAPLSIETIRANIANIDNPGVQRVLLSALDSAKDDLERTKKFVEEWYDSGMDRVSGWYKRSTQWIIFAIAFGVAVVFNVNAIAITEFLYQNKSVRDALVAQAGDVARNSGQNTGNDAIAQLKSLHLPIGWTRPEPSKQADADSGSLGSSGLTAAFAQLGELSFWEVATPLLGWLLVAFAASMGAPFWFDLLNKFMVIRSTVKPHEKSPEEGSEDR